MSLPRVSAVIVRREGGLCMNDFLHCLLAGTTLDRFRMKGERLFDLGQVSQRLFRHVERPLHPVVVDLQTEFVESTQRVDKLLCIIGSAPEILQPIGAG